MATILVIGTIAAVPASAGGRASSTPSRTLVPASAATSGLPADRTPEVNYWHRLAVKRLRLLGQRERRIVRLLTRIRAGRASDVGTRVRREYSGGGVKGAICSVFGAHCSEALRVAQCESGFNIYARNGQYWGLFQFGSFARARYGFAWNAWTQARSAYRYFLDAGWSPWQCRP